MKKIILTALFLAACSASAFAATQIGGSTTLGSLTFAPSNKVYLNAYSNASFGYQVDALHTSGSRVFVTDSSASKLYWKDQAISISGTTVTGFVTTAAPTAIGGHGTPDITTTSGYSAL